MRRLAGGDVNDVVALTLDDGRTVVVKGNARAPAGLFAAEARGLAFLAAPEALRTPAVLAVADDFLVLEHVARGRPAPDHDERLGRGLAALHRASPSQVPGLDHDNFIGPLPQQNAPTDDWATFYGERRLFPMAARGQLDRRARRRLEALVARLPGLVGPPEAPSRLHGDLWGGNLLTDPAGLPCLIDPAVYAGHREMDLAMMRLFGGFGSRVFAAYAEAHPLAEGHEERVPLYQLYPLLVHVALFGGGYVGGVERALTQLGV
ncbi:MAG: fructosamine kinase family protein [Myxococcota bacterium]